MTRELIFDVWEGSLDIDESAMQGQVAGFVIRLNSMSGGHRLDKNFANQWQQASKFYRAAYFVYNPWVSGQANFNWLVKNCPIRKSIFVDIEVTRPFYSAIEYAKQVNEFYKLARKEFGKVVIYTGEWFLNRLSYWPAGAEFWWAQYPSLMYPDKRERVGWYQLSGRLGKLSRPYNWNKIPGQCVMWQCSGDRLIPPGSPRAMDVNLWLGGNMADYFVRPDATEPQPEQDDEPETPPVPPERVYLFDVSDFDKMRDVWGWAPPVNFLFYRLFEKKAGGGFVRMGTISLPDAWRPWLVRLQMSYANAQYVNVARAEKIVQWADNPIAGPTQGGIKKWIVADTPAPFYATQSVSVRWIELGKDGKSYAAIDYINAAQSPPAIDAGLVARNVIHRLYQMNQRGELTAPSGLAGQWYQPIISKVQPYICLDDLVLL